MRQFDDIDTLYETIYRNGIRAKPRGLYVKELYDVSLQVKYGTVVTRNGLNQAIGIMEGLQFIACTFDYDAIKRVAPNARLELFTEQSAYGPRIKNMLHRVVKELKEDSDTRRAILMIANSYESGAQLPCTISYQFHRPNETMLNATVYMRSSDIVWGLPYDIVQFQMMLEAVAMCLGVDCGYVTIHIGNSHLYESTALNRNNEGRRYSYSSKRIEKFIPVSMSELIDIQAYCTSTINDIGTADALIAEMAWKYTND